MIRQIKYSHMVDCWVWTWAYLHTHCDNNDKFNVIDTMMTVSVEIPDIKSSDVLRAIHEVTSPDKRKSVVIYQLHNTLESLILKLGSDDQINDFRKQKGDLIASYKKAMNKWI